MKLGPTFNEMFSTVSASESWNKHMLPRMLHVQHTRPAVKGLKQCETSGEACATHHIGLMLSQLTSDTHVIPHVSSLREAPVPTTSLTHTECRM